MALTDEKYLALTTFRRNGEGKMTPIWIADLGGGTMGFTTASSSWKVKRLRADPRVVVQPSDAKGGIKPGTEPSTGTAVIAHGAEFDRVRAVIAKKYGIQMTVMSLIGKAAKLIGKGSGADTAIIISLNET